VRSKGAQSLSMYTLSAAHLSVCPSYGLSLHVGSMMSVSWGAAD